MGLTDNTLYYVNAQTTTTLSFHTTPDDAIDDLSKVNLTASGTETHAIYDANAAVWNSSGGTVTLNIEGGGTNVNFRNTSGSTTNVNQTVTVAVHVEDADGTAVQNAQVYIQKDPATSYTSGAGNTAGDRDWETFD